MAAAPSHFNALGRALVQQGKLVQADANAIQAEATRGGVTFVQQLIQSRKLSARDVSQFAATTFGYPLLKLTISQVAPILPYLFLVLILIFRPKGLLGTRED